MAEDLLKQSFFLINLHGQIEGCEFSGCGYENLYCKCLFKYGDDWALIGDMNEESDEHETKKSSKNKTNKKSGIENKVFISQTANKRSEDETMFILNLPIEATFKSTNAHGWPQIVVSVFGIDNFGNDVVRGYGWWHVPTRPGQHRLQIPLFAPQSSNLITRIAQWFLESRRPEFRDTRMAAGNEGRQLVTVNNDGGYASLLINVLFKDFKKFGFISR